METQNVQPNLFSNRFSPREKSYLAIIIALVFLQVLSLLSLPSLGDPTEEEKGFIEYGYTMKKIGENSLTWQTKEQEQTTLAEENKALRDTATQMSASLFQ